MIDLRSDTVTRPTDAMRTAMARAEVGDDVYGEDPTVRALEERVAALFGHEDALFTPTGSLANVLAVGLLVAPGQEVLCEASAHIARAELGAHGAISGITMRTWIHETGGFDLDVVRRLVAPEMGPFFVRTAAIAVENTRPWAVAVYPASAAMLAAGERRINAAKEQLAEGEQPKSNILQFRRVHSPIDRCLLNRRARLSFVFSHWSGSSSRDMNVRY